MTVASTTSPDQGPIAQAARIWADAGFSVVPIRADGSKRPSIEWKAYQSAIAPPDKINEWWHPGDRGTQIQGIAVICGQVSGNLEMTELEGRATTLDSLRDIGRACEERGVYSTWALLTGDDGYSERSPSGGIHLLYRIVDHEVPGNVKVARRPATADELTVKPDDRIKVLAETRGEGGYVIVAPTPGTVHSTGLGWFVLSGRIGDVPEVTWDQRNLIHEAIHSVLDQMPVSVDPPRAPQAAPQRAPGIQVRPGDDFNERAEWASILIPNGWEVHHRAGGTTYWTRPGKDRRDGHSATTGHAGVGAADRLYVMSSATEFNTEEPMSKLYVYAHYYHGGDTKAAVKELVRQGFGDQTPQFVRPDYESWDTGNGWTKSTVEIEDGRSGKSNVDSSWNQPSSTFPTLARSKGVEDYTLTGACVRFVDKWACCIRYVVEQKMWRVWDGTRWAEDASGNKVSIAWEALTEEMNAEARRMTDEENELAKAYTAHVKKLRNNGPAGALKIIATHVACSADDFDASPRYLNLRNGVFDTVDLVFLKHDPKYMLTKTMGCAYDPTAKAPKAEKFLLDLMPDPDQRDYVMRALGYTLTGEADQRAFFLLHGLPGTGKSQFVEMMRDLFGGYGITAMASTFHKRPNNGQATPDLHALRGVRFITTSETSQETQLDEELIKRFTGKDRISSRSLYEAPQEWTPQGTIWFATNHLPKFASDEDAVWKRVKTLPFVTQFSDDGSTGQLSEPNIGRRIAADEADGIFMLLVEALTAYRADGRLTEPAQVKQAVAEHKRDVDPVAQFVADQIDSGEMAQQPGGRADLAAVYQAYVNYHRQELGSHPLGRRRFANSLRPLLNYDKLEKSNSKTWIPGWIKKGWIVGGTDFWGRDRQ